MHPVLKVILVLAVCYGLLVAAVYLRQREMIYFPDRSKPDSCQVRAAGLEFWPVNDDEYRGFVAACPVLSKGTVIVFHGNAGAAWHRSYYVHALVPLGFNVILAEYPGYGGRSGAPSEASLVEDACQTVQLAFKGFGTPLYLWGESLGCGVAAAVAADSPVPVDGLVLVTPWDSLTDLAQSLYWYLPVRLLLRDRFDSVKNLQGFNKPVAVVMALADEIIPAGRTLRLYQALNQPKRLWKFQAAGHNSWPTGPDEEWWGEVVQFVSSGGGTQKKVILKRVGGPAGTYAKNPQHGYLQRSFEHPSEAYIQ